MNRGTSLLVIGLFLFSCNSNNGNKTEATEENKTAAPLKVEKEIHLPDELKADETDDDPYYHYHTILKKEFNDSVLANFSSLKSKDRFTFYMPAGNIDSTESVVRIYTHEGNLIYEKKFGTHELINGYDLEFIKNETQMQKYVLKQANGVLDKSSFTDLDRVEEYGIIAQSQPEDFESYDTYVECKKEKRPLFCIGLTEEDITYIGFSKKQNKVLDIIYCC